MTDQCGTGVREDSSAVLIDRITRAWEQKLRVWAESGALSRAASKALNLDGSSHRALDDLLQKLLGGDYSTLPGIQLLSNDAIGGALGAYAASTGLIYINKEWVKSADSKKVIAVLTEELGHHLDTLANTLDTLGDEGELLSGLLRGDANIEKGQFNADSTGYIKVNEQLIKAEFSTTALNSSYGGVQRMQIQDDIISGSANNTLGGTARSFFYLGDPGSSFDQLNTSWDIGNLSSQFLAPSGLQVWQVYTTSTRNDYFTAFTPYVDFINFNGKPEATNNSLLGQQRISYLDHSLGYTAYTGRAADDLMIGGILDLDRSSNGTNFKPIGDPYLAFGGAGLDTLFIPMVGQSNHLNYEVLKELGIGRLSFIGSNSGSVSYVTSGIEYYDYFETRFRSSGIKNYNLINSSTAQFPFAANEVADSSFVDTYLTGDYLSQAPTGTTGDDFFAAENSNYGSYYTTYNGLGGTDILYLPRFSSGDLGGVLWLSNLHRLSFSGRSYDLTNIEYVLFNDKAIKLTPGSIAYTTYSWESDPGRPDYQATSLKSAYNEGEFLQASLSAPGFLDGSSIYWSISGSGITPNDFESNTTQGVAAISNEQADISIRIRNDLSTEGLESARVNFYSDNSRMDLLASTQAINIVDTSISTGDTISNDFRPDIFTTGRVSVDGSETGTIAFGGDEDWFNVSLTEGKTYLINLQGSPSGSGTLNDPYFQGVYNSGGQYIDNTTDDDNGFSTESQLQFRPSSTGSYFLSAKGFGSSTGTYRVSVVDITSSVPTLFSSVSAALSPSQDNLVLTGSRSINGTGNTRNNSITGNSATNRLNGLGGNDTITGNSGKDYLTGGTGADIFKYLRTTDSRPGSNARDLITDYSSAQRDRIDLRQIDASSRASGNQSFRWRSAQRFSGFAGELRYSSGVIQADINGDKRVDFEIQLSAAPRLSSTSFIGVA